VTVTEVHDTLITRAEAEIAARPEFGPPGQPINVPERAAALAARAPGGLSPESLRNAHAVVNATGPTTLKEPIVHGVTPGAYYDADGLPVQVHRVAAPEAAFDAAREAKSVVDALERSAFRRDSAAVQESVRVVLDTSTLTRTQRVALLALIRAQAAARGLPVPPPNLLHSAVAP
jgi:hypothetical protein